MPISTRVEVGSAWPKSPKITANFGNTYVSRMVTDSPPTAVSRMGYVRAALISSCTCCARSRYSARRCKTTSRNPPSSPAFTILTYRGGKIFGYSANASAKDLPCCTARRICPTAFLSSSFVVSPVSTESARSRGNPAEISVASSWLQISRSRCLTVPRPGKAGRENRDKATLGFACPGRTMRSGRYPCSCSRETTTRSSPASMTPSMTFP